jgi:hypothetical protein
MYDFCTVGASNVFMETAALTAAVATAAAEATPELDKRSTREGAFFDLLSLLSVGGRGLGGSRDDAASWVGARTQLKGEVKASVVTHSKVRTAERL